MRLAACDDRHRRVEAQLEAPPGQLCGLDRVAQGVMQLVDHTFELGQAESSCQGFSAFARSSITSHASASV